MSGDKIYDLDEIGEINLLDVPGELFLRIRDVLDRETLWMEIAVALDGGFEMTMDDVAKIDCTGNKSARFLHLLGTRGMTLRQLFHYARQAKLYIICSFFNNVTEPVVITSQPFHEMNVCEGECLEMKVEAEGFPPPQFQWHKIQQGPILNATSNILFFPSVGLSESGQYICTVSNDTREGNAVLSSPVNLSVSKAKPLEISEQPGSVTVSRGGNAVMRCDVWGEGTITYQWMKDRMDVTDGPNFQGSQSKELRIYNIDNSERTGLYSCRITRYNEVIYTNEVVLQISWIGLTDHKYTATDKVALLIGAGDYRSDSRLNAPEKDIQALDKVFVSLNFKVVSLYNLTKLEMVAAIREFRQLIWEGVYCVFYFGGHGFESADHLFLVPPDAPHGYNQTHCLSADDILFNSLLPQNPKVCCMILDICRKYRECPPIQQYVHKDIKKGNYIYCYATCQGLSAYESKNYGILVKHLKKILLLDMSIEHVFHILREEISNDSSLTKKSQVDKEVRQIPEVRTTLYEPNRSFKDEILFRGMTSQFNAGTRLWQRAHEKPKDRDVTVPFGDFNIKIRLNFQQEFSNVLKIYISVMDPGPTFSCQAHISAIPMDVFPKSRLIQIKSGTNTDLCQNCVMLYNIQHLKSALMIEITVTCKTAYGVELRRIHKENLGLPLVAPLKLWQERPLNSGPGELNQ